MLLTCSQPGSLARAFVYHTRARRKMKRIPDSPAPTGTGFMEPASLPSRDSPVSNKSSFSPQKGESSSYRVPCLLLVYFHKSLENLLFLRTSVEADLTAALGGSGVGAEQRHQPDVLRAGLRKQSGTGVCKREMGGKKAIFGSSKSQESP